MSRSAATAGGKAANSDEKFGPEFWWTLFVTGTFFAGYNMLIVGVPLLTSIRHQSPVAQGGATLLFMVPATLCPLALTRVRSAYLPVVLTASILVMAVPAALYLLVRSNMADDIVTVVRGMGFGVGIVATGTLAASFAPKLRLGHGLGLYGATTSATALPGQAGAVWMTDHVGYQVTFLVAMALPMLGLAPTLLRLRRLAPEAFAGHRSSSEYPVDVKPREGSIACLVHISSMFFFAACLYGAIVSFVPAHVTSAAGSGAATAFFVALGLALPTARGLVGRVLDKAGRMIFLPALLIAVAGVGLLAVASTGVALVAVALVFGVGFGMLGSVTLYLLIRSVRPSAYSLANLCYSGSYNIGMGVGAILFGLGLTRAPFKNVAASAAVIAIVGVGLVLAPSIWRRRIQLQAYGAIGTRE